MWEEPTAVGGAYLDEVLPLLLARADGLLDAAQLVEDGLGLVQLVVGLTAGHLPVDPDQHRKYTVLSPPADTPTPTTVTRVSITCITCAHTHSLTQSLTHSWDSDPKPLVFVFYQVLTVETQITKDYL